jgi:hypothetical protein
MSGGGGGQPANTTSQVILPQWVQDQAQSNLSAANNVAALPYQADPYYQVAGLTPDQQAAFAKVRQLQGSTDPAFAASEAQAGGLLSSAAPITTGQLTSSTTALFNPYATAVVAPSLQLARQQLAQTKQGIDAQAANVGAFGGSRQGVQEGVADAQEAIGAGQLEGGLLSSGWNTAAGQASDLAKTNLSAGEWATSLLPQLATASTTEQGKLAAALADVGQTQQTQQQEELAAQSAQWEDQYTYPQQQLAIQEQALQAIPYGSTTINTGVTPKRNQALGVLGGAASGAATGAMIGGPYGAVIGGVGGGLLGAFS